MKILNSFGPNPRMLRMFMLEKNINIDAQEYDLMGAENRQDAYLSKNPGGQLPALELDDGTVIAETVVICDYLEELHPEPALIGETAQERAEARMWNRRIEQKITENIHKQESKERATQESSPIVNTCLLYTSPSPRDRG